MREITLLPFLRDELAAYKAGAPNRAPSARVFVTARGNPRTKDNVRQRVLAPVLARADELLAERGHAPLPQGVTTHKPQHTYASMLVAIGKDMAVVMQELGHADARFTLNVYAHAMPLGRGASAAPGVRPGRRAARVRHGGSRGFQLAEIGRDDAGAA